MARTLTINPKNAQRLGAAIFGRNLTLDDVSPDIAQPLEDVLRTISVKEFAVLVLRYGFYDKNGIWRTLEEVGDIMNLTRQRIGQIEKKAFRRLRNQTRYHKLKPYLLNNAQRSSQAVLPVKGEA